jgi:hypothetical protein
LQTCKEKQDQFAKTNKTLQSPQSLKVKKTIAHMSIDPKSSCGLEIIMWGNEMLFFYIIERLPIIDTKIYVQKHFSPRSLTMQISKALSLDAMKSL